MRKPVLLASFLLLLSSLQAQDIHFTMFNMSPLTINPAYTGAYYGTARIGGIYRDQWASFIDNQYTTPSFFVDAPLIRGLRDQDWIGVGGMIVNDQAGAGELQTNATLFSAAYHAGLGKEGSTTLTLGVQGGSVGRQLNLSATDLRFADEIETSLGGGGLGFGNSTDRESNDEATYFDINVGLLLKTELADGQELELGISGLHITQPEYNFLSGASDGDGNQRPLTLAAHGRYYQQLNDLVSIEPMFSFRNTRGESEIQLQALAGYQFNDEIKIMAGPGYRFGDSGQLIGGVQYNDLRVGLAYDINTSALNEVSNYRGGFEIAAMYVIKIFKDPEVAPAILCPQL